MPLAAADLTTSLLHFLRLARQGRHAGASTGERSCHAFAKAILASCPGLDNEALAGMVEFIGLAERMPTTARSLLDPAVQLPTPK